MRDAEGNDAPFEVVSEDAVVGYTKKDKRFEYVAIHVRRVSKESTDYPLTPDDPRLDYFQ